METELLMNNENKDQSIRDELLRFTGERLPRYKWLQNTILIDDLPKTGRDR